MASSDVGRARPPGAAIGKDHGADVRRYGVVKVTTAEVVKSSTGVLIRLPSQGTESLLHASK
jgi:hypothetical protein